MGMRRFAAVLACGLIQARSWAEEGTAGAVDSIGSARHLSSVLLGLVAIIALIFLLAWFYRKASGGNWLRSGSIRILAALALGTRERLLLVDVGGTQILLGVTAQNITRLHVFDEPVLSADEPQANSPFNEKLQAFMAGRGRVQGDGHEGQGAGTSTRGNTP